MICMRVCMYVCMFLFIHFRGIFPRHRIALLGVKLDECFRDQQVVLTYLANLNCHVRIPKYRIYYQALS